MSTAPERVNKRKLDDVLQSLDEAMGAQRPPGERPAKRPHLVHTLYSTLSKYGIKTREQESIALKDGKGADLSNTPHLAAILARTAAKARKALPAKFRSAPTSLSSSGSAFATSYEYRPSSTQSLLERLATYKLNTYANKPPVIDALAAAKCGWSNDGKDRLVCGICRASWVLAGREGMNRDAGTKQRVQLVDMHKDGCPWKKRQCDADVYRIPLASPAVMAKEIKTRARSLEPVLEGVEIKHPLSSTQVKSFLGVIASVEAEPSIREQTGSENGGEEPPIPRSSPPPEPTSTAILTSLFGWSLASPMPSTHLSTTASPSWSRASSVAPQETSAVPSFPHTPRRLSGLGGAGQIKTPSTHVTSPNTPIPSSPRGNVAPERRRDTSLRLGLWAVGAASRAGNSTDSDQRSLPPQTRQIDLLREHRPYCPYVVRSTTVPCLPVAPTNATRTGVPSSTLSFTSFLSSSSAQVDVRQPSAVEGWRAVLMVVLRYRMGQWQRRKVSGSVTERVDGELDTTQSRQQSEVDPVEAMVEGVKSRGGTELLRYVKRLLG
ncbi:C3HC zinc finger-like-domain-containing protein [Russula earlei]|uniref:C3HC zinc finger-like-domain-containing protein n=1 Tax=Russula earlei TaxID=71964 RepID=A0ACC0ULW8_9AGAM|nr:C3HC zinc finger-like-domain-containing protein [Russula earlei]